MIVLIMMIIHNDEGYGYVCKMSHTYNSVCPTYSFSTNEVHIKDGGLSGHHWMWSSASNMHCFRDIFVAWDRPALGSQILCCQVFGSTKKHASSSCNHGGSMEDPRDPPRRDLLTGPCSPFIVRHPFHMQPLSSLCGDRERDLGGKGARTWTIRPLISNLFCNCDTLSVLLQSDAVMMSSMLASLQSEGLRQGVE